MESANFQPQNMGFGKSLKEQQCLLFNISQKQWIEKIPVCDDTHDSKCKIDCRPTFLWTEINMIHSNATLVPLLVPFSIQTPHKFLATNMMVADG